MPVSLCYTSRIKFFNLNKKYIYRKILTLIAIFSTNFLVYIKILVI